MSKRYMRKLYAVDIPVFDPSVSEQYWRNVGYFDTKDKALEFIRKNIGPCDDEGRLLIPLIQEIIELGQGGGPRPDASIRDRTIGLSIAAQSV